jgi:ABC-2 type transport system ATP-binding protein
VVEFAIEDDPSKIFSLHPLNHLNSVQSVREEGEGFCLNVIEPHLAIPALIAYLQNAGYSLSRLTTRHASLEDVFVKLTGRHLRDD